MIHRRQVLAGLILGGATGWARAGSYDDFFVAIIRNEGDAIRALLRRGFDPNTRDPKGQVGLSIAIREERMAAFEALINARGVQVDARNPQGESPLMMAALKGNLPVARALIAKDADVNKTGWTPLHYAASCTTSDAVGMIALLLENYAYIDAGAPNGTTPLMMAAQYGTGDAVRLLLQEGADPAIKNQLGLGAVDFAQRGQRQDLVDLIAEAVRNRQPNHGHW